MSIIRNRHWLLKYFCIIILIMIPWITNAKKIYPLEENQLWVSGELNYNITEYLRLELSEELRYYKNRSVLSESLTNLGAVYKISEYFKTGLYYRYRVIPDNDETRHELYANFYYKPEWNNFELNNRLRLHVKLREQKETINNIRYQISLKYNYKNIIKPYISSEIFYRFIYSEGDRLNQGRYSIGIEFSYIRIHELDIFLMRELEYNTDKAINSSIIGLGYTFNF